MLIIVEGIDRVGKTTLCKEICKNLGFQEIVDKVVDNNYNNEKANAEKAATFVNMCEQLDLTNNYDIILDRFHWSEMAYGVVRNGHFNKYINFLNIDGRLAVLNSGIILVNPVNINKSVLEHGSDLRTQQIVFSELFEKTEMKKFKCNYNNLSEAVEWVNSTRKGSV